MDVTPHLPAAQLPETHIMSLNVLIAFYSRNGSTEALANAVAAGARAEGAEVRLRRARDFVAPDIIASVPGWQENAARMDATYEAPAAEDADWADAVVFGTPTRFGNVSAELKAYIDSLGGLWFQGKLNGKVGAAFVSTQGQHGGNESTVTSLYNPLAHLGFIIVPTGYADPSVFKAGTPYGASAVSGVSPLPTEDELAVARYQGRRVAQVTKKLRGA
jgi:NAD(P)H dehydrogenase (quinone)